MHSTYWNTPEVLYHNALLEYFGGNLCVVVSRNQTNLLNNEGLIVLVA